MFGPLINSLFYLSSFYFSLNIYIYMPLYTYIVNHFTFGLIAKNKSDGLSRMILNPSLVGWERNPQYKWI